MDQEQAEQIVEKTWSDILLQIGHALDYKLFELDGHGVSVAKLLSGLALLVLAYGISRRGAHEFDRRVLRKLNLEESLRYTFERLMFYFLLCVSYLFVLRTLNVPITIFTVVGGALAVGLGFGSQNLVNNFISGILVMIERPIKVGDFVEIEGVVGWVEQIGIRSTLVKTQRGAGVIIPNTSFIEKNLINWNYQPYIVDSVRVGVGYSTDLAQLKKICLEAVGKVPEIINPEVTDILFEDFGDNALIFDVSFSLSRQDYPSARKIRSQLRFLLNESFNRHNITVPYPQRDLHLVDGFRPVLQSQ